MHYSSSDDMDHFLTQNSEPLSRPENHAPRWPHILAQDMPPTPRELTVGSRGLGAKFWYGLWDLKPDPRNWATGGTCQ